MKGLQIQKAQTLKVTQSSISTNIVQSTVQSECLDIVIDMILDDFLGVYSGKMIDQTFTDAIIMEDVFEDLLRSVLTKEVNFQIQLEKDAQLMLQAFLNNQMMVMPEVNPTKKTQKVNAKPVKIDLVQLVQETQDSKKSTAR